VEAADVAVAWLGIPLIGAVYLNSSMFDPKPQRTSVILDHRLGIDAQHILHERALVVSGKDRTTSPSCSRPLR